MMRILVTGGTGFIGQRLVQKLKEKKHQPIVFANNDVKVKGAEKIRGDLLLDHDLEKLKGKRFDAVYHLAAQLDESSPDMWKVNVDGTRNLLELCKRRQLFRFIMLNPIGLLGDCKTPATEDTAYDPKTKYEQSKVEAERLVMDYRLKHGIPYTILRSTIVLGPNRFWKSIFAAAKEEFPIIGNGENFFHLVYVDDVVQALVEAMQPIAKNEIYNIAGPDVHTYKETYDVMKKALRLRFKYRFMPVIAAKAGAALHETGQKIKGENAKLTYMVSSIDRLVRNRNVDISKAKADLGYKPKWKLEKAMQKTVKELGFSK